MKNIFVISGVAALLWACGGKAPDNLEARKKQLDKYKNQLQELELKIAELEKEIALMDTSGSTGLKSRLVKVDTLKGSEFVHYIDIQGTIDSDENILVSPEMPGVITAIHVKEGDRVTRGTLLANMDASTLSNTLEEVKTSLALATTAYEKQKRLWDQNIGSEMQYLQAKTQKENLENRVKTIEAQIAMTRMKSPINGTVDAVNVKIGEMANPGLSGIRVVNLDKVKVKAMVSDNFIANIRKGDEVIIELPDIGKVINAKISFVGQVINQQNRSFAVEVNLDNKEKMLRPNMIAKLKIKDLKLEDVLVVSSNLIQRAGNQRFIMVAVNENGNYVARKREVTTGSEYDGKTVITSGLTNGDLVIVSGQNEVVDGQPLMF
ncbi:MAG: efflux RND transporter periplasmic adaptor subunit [Flavobacteriales bacterium]|nr:efflux RND transporter periplasmic adaptor subunit [Flavobacteriales bacterium]